MSNKLRKSDKTSSRLEKLSNRLKNGEIDGEYFDKLVEINDMIEMSILEKEQDLDFEKNNLEYDLRTSDWIAEKCEDRIYAQHLYAALCNNEFIKNDVWPILNEEKWSCSWRHSGGIIADIRESGDYMDWYCSGMTKEYYWNNDEDIDLNKLNDEQIETYLETKAFINEGIITDEIKKDLLDLGWIISDND